MTDDLNSYPVLANRSDSAEWTEVACEVAR